MALVQKQPLLRFLLSLLLFFLAVELFFRVAICLSFHTPFSRPSLIICKYYPELKPLLLNPVIRSENKINILILGGSAISDLFCHTTSGLEDLLKDSLTGKDVNVYNLATVAQNSLDARYKLQWLQQSKFDYIVFYEGINDTRANNCPPDIFDTLYRHIEFYQDIAIIHRHHELDIFTTAFAIDYGWHKLLMRLHLIKTIPKEFYILDESCNCLTQMDPTIDKSFIQYGSVQKTKQTYQQNIDAIYSGTLKTNSKFILLSYAHYLPADYNVDIFLAKRKTQKTKLMFPAEIWGLPQNVDNAISLHNDLARILTAAHKDILWFDFDKATEKTDSNFMDICHLSEPACQSLHQRIAALISYDAKRGQ